MSSRRWLQVSPEVEYKTCHVLPCAIKHDGTVDGSNFQVTDLDGHLQSQFRGRPLRGFKVDLKQHGYSGYCLGSTNDEESGEQLVQKAAFDTLVTWAHGKDPSSSDFWGKNLDELLRFSRMLCEN